MKNNPIESTEQTKQFLSNKNPTEDSSNATSGNQKTKLEQVAEFFNQHKVPELKEIIREYTPGFVKEFLEPRLRYNLLTQDVELDGNSLRRHESEALKVEERILIVCENDYQVKFKNEKEFRTHLRDAISRNYYHPVEQFLKGLESVAPVNIDNLAERYLGNQNELDNILIKKTLIAAVARILEPGCEVHSVLILHSPQQGIGKSSFLRTLAKNPAWFNDTVPEIKLNQDLYSKIHQHWITEIGEIDTKFKRKKEEEIKDFITSSKDSFRPAYTATLLKCRRRFILTGTTNNGNFLTDQTGSRRYWIVSVHGKIDIPSLEKEVDGIWAAAVQAYNAGEQWWLNEQESKMLQKSNASYTYEHPWYQAIKRYLDCHKSDEYILPKNIAAIPDLDIPKREINKPNSKAIKEIRKLLQQKFGYYPKKISAQQRQSLLEKLSNNPTLQPQVRDINEIPYSIWVKYADFVRDDLETNDEVMPSAALSDKRDTSLVLSDDNELALVQPQLDESQAA